MFSFFSVLKPTAAPEQPLISPDEGETQGDLWDPPNFIRVVTGVELQGGQCACTAAQPHTHGLHSPKAISLAKQYAHIHLLACAQLNFHSRTCLSPHCREASPYQAVSRIARDGHKGHLWSQTVMPLFSEETGMSLSGS